MRKKTVRRRTTVTRKSKKKSVFVTKSIRYLSLILVGIFLVGIVYHYREGLAYYFSFKSNKVLSETEESKEVSDARNFQVLEKSEGKTIGLDVSEYQEKISWSYVDTLEQKYPLDFVFIRATVGNDRVDSQFKRNWLEAKEFIQDHTNILEADLHTSLYSEYTRITLLHKAKKEKVTLDFNLQFYDKYKSVLYDNIVIAEIKTEQITANRFNEIMKKYKIRSGSLSKYCWGLVSLNPKLKQNNFKMMLNQIIKVNTHG